MIRRQDRRRIDGPQAPGFTLVEILLAALVLGLAVVGLLTAFPVGYRDIAYAGRVSEAVELAQQKLEELKDGPFPPTNGTAASGAYTLTWTVTSVGFGGAAGDLQKVNVTVSWAQTTRPGRYDLAGFISKSY